MFYGRDNLAVAESVMPKYNSIYRCLIVNNQASSLCGIMTQLNLLVRSCHKHGHDNFAVALIILLQDNSNYVYAAAVFGIDN